MVTVAPDVMFQATDLSRRARDVMDAAHKPGGALIRDKDGMAFVLIPAGPASLVRYERDGLRNALRMLRLLVVPQADRVLLGEFAWLDDLPGEERQHFLWEYVVALESVSVGGVGEVEALVHDWQQTARAYADPHLRSDLTDDVDDPLHDVEL